LFSLEHIKSAIRSSLGAIISHHLPDNLDAKAKSVLDQEKSNADLVQSRSDSIKEDTKLRKLIVYFLGFMVVVVVTYFLAITSLKIFGIVAEVSWMSGIVAPGGILTVLVGGLVWMLKRP
jgi:hypothetical protein